MTTAQEQFWKGDFGGDYISRNEDVSLYSSNVSFFSNILSRTQAVSDIFEVGCNVGMNLRALHAINPTLNLGGIDINEQAIEVTKSWGKANVQCGSILDVDVDQTFDLVFTKGVLIHIDPDSLISVYDKMYQASSKYILVAEYYNPTPVSIDYRGHQDKLFKRDFAGDMLDRFDDLVLVDYGFVYKRDLVFPQDDITWFLMKKV